MHAIDLANALAEFEPYWFEEPCQSENVEALAEVRACEPHSGRDRRSALTRAGFRPIIRARAVDIINPDVSNCGGILELMYIAAAAESEAIAVSPHNYNSTTWRFRRPCTRPPACRTSSSPNISCRSRSSVSACVRTRSSLLTAISRFRRPRPWHERRREGGASGEGKAVPARTFRSLDDEGP